MPLFSRKSDKEQLVREKYDMKEVLGTGAFSEVIHGIDKVTAKEVAIKIIDKSQLKGKENVIQNEVEILSVLDHPNIIKLLETEDTKTHMYLVMDLVTGGELFDRIVERGSYTERDAVDLMKAMLEAVGYMHENGICHRDLKPENLLYQTPAEDSKIVISDFGLARRYNDGTVMKHACGTPGYVAPEVLQQKPYNEKVDCWSLGIIAYILLCGYPPFYDDEDSKLFEIIIEGVYEFDSPYWDDISSEAQNFVQSLLQMSPDNRLSCKEALEHPWIAEGVAKSIDIHKSVSEQIKRNFAKKMWKKALTFQTAISRMQKLTGAVAAAAAAAEPPPAKE